MGQGLCISMNMLIQDKMYINSLLFHLQNKKPTIFGTKNIHKFWSEI